MVRCVQIHIDVVILWFSFFQHHYHFQQQNLYFTLTCAFACRKGKLMTSFVVASQRTDLNLITLKVNLMNFQKLGSDFRPLQIWVISQIVKLTIVLRHLVTSWKPKVLKVVKESLLLIRLRLSFIFLNLKAFTFYS